MEPIRDLIASHLSIRYRFFWYTWLLNCLLNSMFCICLRCLCSFWNMKFNTRVCKNVGVAWLLWESGWWLGMSSGAWGEQARGGVGSRWAPGFPGPYSTPDWKGFSIPDSKEQINRHCNWQFNRPVKLAIQLPIKTSSKL
jgi:hypothetical protein